MHSWCLFAIVILLQAVENKGSPTWPCGEYTLLKPITGCPAGWHDKGYIYQDTIDKNPSNNRSETLHIDGKVACSHVKRYFCSKTNQNGTRWPPGQYCVYRHKNKKLHSGMRAGSIAMYGEKINNKDDFQFTKFRVSIKKTRKSYQYMRLYFTCRRNGNKKIPISLPITKPFYLLPYGSRDCQQVKWMVATSEWIKYHTKNSITKSGKQKYGTVPYHELGDRKHKGITMYYCYYENCNYTLNDKKGVFQSPGFPGKYPDGQLCSWRIMVPDNHTLHVRFTNFSLNKNDILKYSKRINGSFRSRYTISFSVVPFTMSADSDVRFFFRSDESNTSSGFRAEYRVFIPQVTTTTTKKPSTVPPVTTTLRVFTIPSSKSKLITTKLRSSTMQISAKASTTQPMYQYDKSDAEVIKDSPFSSGNKAIFVIVIPAVCFLVGFILLIMIIYQYRIRKQRSRTRNSKRDKKPARDCSVINPTYESSRGDIPLNPLSETAIANIALNRGDDSSTCRTLSRDSQDYEEVEFCEKLNKETPNEKTPEKKSGSVKDSYHIPFYHKLEVHDPKTRSCSSQSEPKESQAVLDSGPNPLYYDLERPDPNNASLAEDQSYEDVNF